MEQFEIDVRFLIQRYHGARTNNFLSAIMLGHLSHDLRQFGWASVSLGSNGVPPAESPAEIAHSLGQILAGKKGLSDSVSPRPAAAAPLRSLSRKFGLGLVPLHCDTAHWIVPCRYVVLACAESGSVDAPTILLDTLSLDLSNEERLLARSSCFLVRSGRGSFYASIIDSHRSFVRVDPGCMEPLSQDGVDALSLYSYERHRDKTAAFHWKIGHVLVIDNWRVLHGRGNDTPADSARRLVRIYVQ